MIDIWASLVRESEIQLTRAEESRRDRSPTTLGGALHSDCLNDDSAVWSEAMTQDAGAAKYEVEVEVEVEVGDGQTKRTGKTAGERHGKGRGYRFGSKRLEMSDPRCQITDGRRERSSHSLSWPRWFFFVVWCCVGRDRHVQKTSPGLGESRH